MQKKKVKRHCPGEAYEISRFICKGRQKAHYPKCSVCPLRNGAMEDTSIFEEEEDSDQVLTPAPQTNIGSIMIKSEPSSAKIYIDGDEIGASPVMISSIVPGSYSVEARMDGYTVWSESINVEPDKETAVTAVLRKISGSISINSKPSKAKVYLDGKDIGASPVTVKAIATGMHTVEVRMSGYAVWSESVNVEPDKETAVTAALQKISGSIGIKSKPSNATVFLDGRNVGATPVNLKPVVPGMHTVEVRMDGYETWSKSVDVKADKQTALTATLRLKTGLIMIESDPSNAKIYLDGKEIGTTPDAINDLSPGKYTVEVRMNGYEVWSESVDVEADKETALTATLQRKTGSISIQSNPSNAEVYLNGKDIGPTPGTLKQVKPGRHTIEVRMDGYKVWSESVDVEADQETVVTVTLQMKTGSISIQSNPSNAEVYLNGKDIGLTPGTLKHVTPGRHMIEVRMDGYKAWSESVDVEADQETVVTVTLQMKTGSIGIKSNPSDAKVYLDGKEAGSTPATIKRVAPGKYMVEVRMDGYKTWSESVDVRADKETALAAILQIKTGSIMIESDPSNAEIYLDDKKIGATPNAINGLIPGKHTVEARMDGYEAWSEIVDVEADKETVVTVTLQMKTGSIGIKSNPSGAKVYLDGKDAGSTPATIKRVAPGKYMVEVRMDGYKTWSESVDVRADKETALTTTLQMKTGSVSIQSNPSNAKVYLNDKDIGLTPGTIKRVKPGKHTVEVRMDGYEAWSESVDVEADKETVVTVTLQIKTGSIGIKINPSGAKVYLDGKDAGSTPATIKRVVPGKYMVEVRKDGYVSWSESVDVRADKETALTATLQIKTGSIMIESEPSNAEIYLDDKKIGATPNTINGLIPGKHTVEVRMDGYEAWSESVDVEADKETVVTVTLQIKTGSISIQSNPSNAKVYLNGKDICPTPGTIKHVTPGKHMVEVRMDGYEVWSESVDVRADKETALTVTLQIKTGSIMIESDPSNAEIYLDGKKTGATPKALNGLNPGKYMVEVRMDGYGTWSESVHVEADKESALTATLQTKTGSIMVKSEPSNAKIYLNGKEIETTPNSIKDLIPGRYTVEIRMDGYKLWSEESVDVEADKETALTATLQMKTGSIMIESEPSNAEIYLDGKKIGATPNAIEGLKPGKYMVEVRMDGYEVWSESVDAEADRNKILTPVLQMKTGSIMIKSNPLNAKVYLDGKESGTTPETIKNLKPGKHLLEIRMDGYAVWSESVTIDAGREKVITPILQKRDCSITIDSTPSNAKIYLDGEEAGTTPHNLHQVSPGKHEVEVKLDGYAVWKKMVSLKAGKEIVLAAALQRKTGSLMIKSEPSKAQIHFNNKALGFTPDRFRNLAIGTYLVTLKKDGYEDWSENVNIDVGRETTVTATLIRKTGLICIQSEPSDAKVFLDGKYLGSTPANIKYVLPGKHTIEIRMDGYAVWNKSVDIEADKESALTAMLQTKTGAIMIKSEPSNANAYLNGKDIGFTPVTMKPVTPGKHRIEVRMDGYKVWSESVEVEADKETALMATLQIKTGSIMIDSNPSNAKIYLNGKEIETTPHLINDLKPGKYTVEVRTAGYAVWSKSVDIEADKESALTATLQTKTGSIMVKSKPSNANAYLNGKDIGFTPVKMKPVTPGKHRIEVRMDGYEVWSESVDVEADKETVVTATLQIKTGSIMIDSDPSNAKIYLNGKEIETTPNLINDLKPGKYTVEVRMAGYEVWSKSVDIEADKESALTATLQRKTGSIMIRSKPSDAKIYLDGREIGSTPDVIRAVTPGTHLVEIKKDGYEVWNKNVVVATNREETMEAILRIKTGSVLIESEPSNARIYINGKERGITPVEIRDLKPGTYTVEARKDGYEIWNESVDVEADKHKVLTPLLEMKTGSIHIKSEPSYASIYINGNEIGTTPEVIEDLKPGKYTVELKMDGYEAWNNGVVVETGSESTLMAELTEENGSVVTAVASSDADVYSDGGNAHTTPEGMEPVIQNTYEKNSEFDKKEILEPALQIKSGFQREENVSSPEGRITLRSTYCKLSVSQIHSIPQIMIRDQNKHIFLCHSTISHSYELKMIYDGEVVVDHTTALMWHQSGSSDYMSLRKANKWLKKMNKKGYAGYNDWRLPTLEEASSLLELKQAKGNYIDPVFEEKQWGMWTGDREGWNTAWIVTFVNGTINRSNVGVAATYVRPVRSLI